MSTKSTFIRSDPSMLIIEHDDNEFKFRNKTTSFKSEKKLLNEKIRCTACNAPLKNAFTKGRVSFHPAFEVIICKDCENFYASGEFSVDEDGSDVYCRWCGQGGSLYCCSRCSVAICEKCVKINFSKNYLNEIEDDEWKCFICDPKPIWPHRALAAAVREYLAKHTSNGKHKRRNSNDSDNSSPPRVKRARKDSSITEDTSDEKVEKTTSQAASDSADENVIDSPAKRSKGKSGPKSSKKNVIIISDGDVEDDSDVTSTSRNRKSKKEPEAKKIDASDLEEETEDEAEKPRKSSRKCQTLRKKSNHTKNIDSSRKSEKFDSKKSNSSARTNRLSSKVITDDDELDSDRSIFRDTSSTKKSSHKSPVKPTSSRDTRGRSMADGMEELNSEAKVFRHQLKDSLKAIDKFLKIVVNSQISFRDKYLNETNYLKNTEDVGVAQKKFLAFLSNVVNSAKRIEDTFSSSIEPPINGADSTKVSISGSPSPIRESGDTSRLSNGVVNKSPVEESEKSNSEDETEKKSSSKMEVDGDADMNTTETQNASAALSDVEMTSTPASPKSTSPIRQDSDDENDASSSSEVVDDSRKNETETKNSSLDASIANIVDENSDQQEVDANETTVDSVGVSDSLIVNLGTEDESFVSEKGCKLESSKEEADNDLPEKCDDENGKSDEREHEKKSSVDGNDCDGSDVDDNTVNDVEHSKSEESAKSELLRKSESSSENEIDASISQDKRNHELSSRSPSPNKSSNVRDSKDERAKNDLLNESDEDDNKNDEIANENDVDGNCTDDVSDSKEKSARKKLLESSDSSADHHSKSSSDSGMSGVDALQKNSDNKKSLQKRRTKRLSKKLETSHGKDTDDEEKEINRLTNLKTLKKKKTRDLSADSNEEEIHSDSEKENQETLSNTKKSAKKSVSKKSLEDYISNGSGNDSDTDEDPFQKLNSFLDEKKLRNSTMTQNDFCKQQLLDSSDSNKGNESDTEDELILPCKPKKEKKSRATESKNDETDQSSKSTKSDQGSSSENDEKKKKRAAWRNDCLLRGKLSLSDSSDDEKIASRIRKREAADEKKKNESCNSSDSENIFRTKPPASSKKKRRVLKSSSDESSSSSVQIVERKETKKRKPYRKRIKNLWTDSDDDSDKEDMNDSQTQGSASKGRKNIRKVLKDEELAEETRVTAKQEEARKKRISERQALFNEVFQVVDVESETPKKLVLDFDPESKTELVSVHPNLVKKLKPHQAKGIKFMWDSCFESIKQIEKNRGSGCILAHCMGLGKTLQVIALVHTVLRYPATKIKKVLVICPVSTILNWVSEFKTWLDGLDGDDESDIDVWYFNKNQKNAKERAYVLKRWSEEGGVMILGYDMFRILVNSKTLPQKWRQSIHEYLLDPGADLVVCDEGHTLKNEKSAISVAAMKIRTRRRVVLTGTPLQNNLIEYHCMVQFIKPNLLGDKKEFQNRFANPITNGQFTNSTSHDVRLMKRRSHVLHKMLDGIVQRFDYNVLTPFLPPKHEFVISVALSDLQAKLYEHYIRTYSRVSNNGENRTLFKDYQIMRLIWTHPFAMNKSFEKRMKLEADKEERDSIEDFVVSGSDESSSGSEKSSGNSVVSIRSGTKEKSNKIKTRSKKDVDLADDTEPELEIDPKAGAWWRPFITDEDIDDYKQGPKLVLLFAILRECELIGDKVLIFSQSIPSLDMIEHFLQKTDEFSQYGSLLDGESNAEYLGTWRKNVDYFRLDGSTPSELRTEYTNRFNHSANERARLFLISTKAGGLGINLTAANRVIIFDASWNPSHDVQSIFRVYRFGQKKPCYIYRFLSQKLANLQTQVDAAMRVNGTPQYTRSHKRSESDSPKRESGTMEEKIYERQVTKLSISCRVVDEQQIDRHFSRNEIEELYTFARKSPSEDEIPKLPKDRLMAEMLKKFKNIILTYHEHDSLLENIVDEELTEEERKQAWEEYENDKKPKPPPIYPPLRPDALHVSDETIMNSIRQQNPNATPEQLEEMKKKVRIKIMQYYAEQQRKLLAANQQNMQHIFPTNLHNVPVSNKKELDEAIEVRRRALAYNMLMQDKTSLDKAQNPGFTRVAGLRTPTKTGISPSKYASYASPVKAMPTPWSADHTPLKLLDSSPSKDFGESDGDGRSAPSFEPPSTFKPLETPSTWAFKWTTPRSLDYLERVLKANCRFTARYDRVGENVLMHLPFCVRADTLKRKLADHLPNISFSHVSADGLDESDVLDVIIDNLALLG